MVSKPTYVDVEGHRLEHVEWIDNVIDHADAFTAKTQRVT